MSDIFSTTKPTAQSSSDSNSLLQKTNDNFSFNNSLPLSLNLSAGLNFGSQSNKKPLTNSNKNVNSIVRKHSYIVYILIAILIFYFLIR